MRVKLSAREAQIVVLVVEGKTVKEISQGAHLTVETVKSYLKRIRSKYRADGRDVSTMVRLARCAIEDGQVPPILPRTEAAR